MKPRERVLAFIAIAVTSSIDCIIASNQYTHPNRKKILADHRAAHRAQLLEARDAFLDELGITISSRYEKKRELLNVDDHRSAKTLTNRGRTKHFDKSKDDDDK